MQNNIDLNFKGFEYPTESQVMQKQSKSPQKKKIFQDPLPPPMPANLNKQNAPTSFENVRNPMDDSHLTSIAQHQKKQLSNQQNQNQTDYLQANEKPQSEKIASQSVINPMDLTEDDHQKQEEDINQINKQNFKKNIKKNTQVTILSKDDELNVYRGDAENPQRNQNISKIKDNYNQSNIVQTEPSNVYPFNNMYHSQLTIGMEGHMCSGVQDQDEEYHPLSGRKEEFLTWASAAYMLQMFLHFSIVCMFLTIFLPCYLVTVPRQISKMPKKQKKLCNNCNQCVNEIEINMSQKPELFQNVIRFCIICIYPIHWLITGYPFQKYYLDFILYIYQIIYDFFLFAIKS